MLKQILTELIQFKTLSFDTNTNAEALDWVQGKVKHLPLYAKRLVINKFPSLLLTTRRTTKPFLWLQAHIDVVGGSASVFRPKLVGNRLYGRGTFDMKYAVACYIQLLNELGSSLTHYDLGVMLTTDEELGGANGVGALLKRGYQSQLCLLPDGGSNWSFEVGAKGIWQLMVESQGVSAHSSRPWLGTNAITELIHFLQKLQGQFIKEPCHTKDHYHNTVTISRVEGGQAINHIPASARAWLDIRFIPETRKKVLEALIYEAKKGLKGISVKELVYTSSFKNDPNNKYLRGFSSIAQKQFHIKPKFIFSHGSSDARYFVNNKPTITTISLRPTGGGHHSDKEWINLKDLYRFYKVLKIFVGEFGRTNSVDFSVKTE